MPLSAMISQTDHPKILIVENQPEKLRTMQTRLTEMGLECVLAADAQEAIQLIQNDSLDIILTNQKIPDSDGFAILKIAMEADPNIPVIIYAVDGSIGSAVQAIKKGAFEYLNESHLSEMMEAVIPKAIEYRKLKLENQTLRLRIKDTYELNDVIFDSGIMQQIAKNVVKMAKSDANVLIFGESGTGKELIARCVHQYSHRKKEPFIPLDCVAFPPTLLESELFGFEKGAFTGAIQSKPGVFELARKGTLFLDEITEMDYHMQAKLLRVLQERKFRRIGGKEFLKADVRIVSATNRDPEEAVKGKKLREDLYYRLNVVPIYVPPLRERKEDIPLLINHFIQKYNPFSEIEVKGISSGAVQSLTNYDWPGNVRELENVIHRVLSFADHDTIEIDDLPEQLRLSGQSIFDTSLEMSYKEVKKKWLDNLGKQYFHKLLEKHNGNVSKAAQTAGISRKTLYRLLDEHNIPR
jgi:two-component system response regulator AtoC